jgi:capsular exopolysaccharide synthesis family protein
MPQPETSLHFNEYFRIIRNRLWVIFTIFALTLVSGIYVTEQVLPKSYTATAQIRIQGAQITTTAGLGSLDTSMERSIDSQEFQTEYERINSEEVLDPVITDLGLDKTWAKRVYKSTTDRLPLQDARTYMKSILTVNFHHGTSLVEISARSEVPAEAAAIANAVVESYKKLRDSEQAGKSSTGADTLREQIADQQKIVDDRKATREKLRQELSLKGIVLNEGSEESSSLETTRQQELQSRQRDLLEAQQDADHRRVLYDSTKNLSDSEFVATLEGMQRASANLTQLQTDILNQESTIQNLLKQGFAEDHPRVQAVQAQLAQEREQYTTLIAGARNALKIDSDMADAGVRDLQGRVRDLETQYSTEQSQEIGPFADADREYQRQQTLLDTLNVRLKETLSGAPLLESPVKIIESADVPDFPSSPNVNLNIALSAGAGLFCGVIVAFLIEYLDTSVKTMADAEHLLGLPVLTIIPNKGGPMPLTQQTARLPHAEGYRILRAKLNLKVQNGLGPCLTMLSGGPGEGKSTTIYNLAIVCAQSGQSVILVDCDLRRPTLHDLLDVPNDRGVSSYLRGEGDCLEFIQQTALPKLHVLTAGETPIAEIGNFSGDKIRQMMDELKQRYDLVLIDSPPVLGISDGSIIAREVDYVILVIQHRRYPREISLRAKRAVEEVHGNCVGMVLNAVAVKSDDSYYYYSSYGSYYQKDGAKKRRRKKKSPNAVNGTDPGAPGAVRVGPADTEEF